MAITQLSFYIENKPGKLAEVVKAAADAGINIRAMSLADTKDFGVLRLIISDYERAEEIFGENVIVTKTKVVAVEMNDKTGALYKVLKELEKEQINVEYMYAFTGSQPLSAYVVLRVDNVEEAEAVLKDRGIASLSDDDIKNILA